MICTDCMVSPALKTFVLGRGSMDECQHCGKTATVVEEQSLIDYICALFETTLAPYDTLPHMTQMEWAECGVDHPIYEIYEHLQRYPPSSADDFNGQLCTFLEQEFDGQVSASRFNRFYTINEGSLTENEFSSRWEGFLQSIQSGHRFFNKSAEAFLDELFHVLLDDFDLAGKAILHLVDNQTSIFRARIASAVSVVHEIQACPVTQLGPTPSHLASDQRMSPAGISVFYGAMDRETCISEIRPLVGDFVVSGEFRAMRQLRLIDLNKLPGCKVVDDIYHEDFVQHAHAVSFFNELVFQMSRPARRSAGNPYLSTQFIFEYLRVKFGDIADGLLYSSVQQDQSGSCIALFPEASLVSPEPVSRLTISEDFYWEAHPAYCLFCVPDALRYHRVRGVNYVQEEDDSDYLLTASDRLQTLTGTRF